jgi:hypothetical protein
MRSRIWRALLSVLVALAPVSTSPALAGPPALTPVARAPHGLRFVANCGQADARADFVARARGYALFLTATDAAFAFGGEAVHVRLAGASARAEGRGVEPAPGTTSYFRGSDPSKWRASVPAFARVRYDGVYPGVDVVYYGAEGGLEYDFVVAPGADPAAIALSVDGGAPRVDASGDLVIATRSGELRERRPSAFQLVVGRRHEVACRYELRPDGRVGLRLGDYDRSAPLVVDPTIAYATYLGGSELDAALAVAKAADGSLYVVGSTASLDFPGLPQTPGIPNGTTDVFVTRLSADGSTVAHTSIVGGSLSDVPSQVKLDAAGNIYVRGFTSSTNFPTVNAAQSTYGGGGLDLFVFRLDPAGTSLAYSTYLGGEGLETCLTSFDVDPAGNAYVTGCTQGPGYPTKNAIQSEPSGIQDGVFTKLSPNGQLLASTYLGGTMNDALYDVAVDATGAIHLVGVSFSDDFPIKNALHSSRAGGGDAVVMQLTPDGTQITYSTFFGGSGSDFAFRAVADSLGNVFVGGQTDSEDFPVSGAVQPTYGGGQVDGFVARFAPDGGSVAFATYVGGQGLDAVFGLGLDGAGGLHVAGFTSSTDFPTKNAIQSALGGANDVFVEKLDAAGAMLDYATYLGGSDADSINSIAVDENGNTYVPIITNSTDLPVAGGVQQAYAGKQDGAEVTIADTYTLDWDEPQGAGNPPRNLTATREEPSARGDGATARGGVTGYNVYRSSSPNVQPTPANFFASVPATQTTLPGAPGGSFFVVTATTGSDESSASNTAAAGAGPGATLGTVKVKSTKITAKGSGFTSRVDVFVDGIPFAAPAKAKSTKVAQKGALLTGQTIGAYLAAHGGRAVISFRNSDGGVATFAYGH